jgi:subtilisin family serine protease
LELLKMDAQWSAQLELNGLLATTQGSPAIIIGLIDGPVAPHPDLEAARLQTLLTGSAAACENIESPACQHGTFIAGILCSKRESLAPGICPGCTVLLRPIFCEVTRTNPNCPEVTPSELKQAIRETVDAGVNIINLSLGLASAALLDYPGLQDTFDYALQKGVLLVAASGNQGSLGPVPLFKHPWVIPVSACDAQGRLEPSSNIGLSIGKRGLMAPGVGVRSTAPGGTYTTTGGTSVAVPFVTGTIALLWSLFPETTASQMRQAILRPGLPRRSVSPPLLNARESWQALKVNS